MAKNKLYTKPIVCKCKSGWFVFFRYWNNDESKYIAKKISRAGGQDFNRIKDLTERLQQFNALRESREIWLKMGWNPIANPEFKQKNNFYSPNDFDEIKNWSVSKAITHALDNKRLAVKSKYDYKKSVSYFLKAAKAVYVDLIAINSLSKTHIKAVFSWMIQNFNISAKNYNKRLMHIKSLLSELVEWNALEHNPAFGIKDLPEEQTHKFVTLTAQEREMIREYLFSENYRFYIFCLVIYYTGIRPDEILSLRIKDINFNRQTLHLQPFSNVVKNKKEREVIIHQNLFRYFEKMELNKCNEDYFIFGTDFYPGIKKVHRRVATSLWNKLVMQELGIQKYMYSLKHLGATDYIKAGADEGNIVDHLGHSSKIITRMYTQEGIEQSKNVISKTKIEF